MMMLEGHGASGSPGEGPNPRGLPEGGGINTAPEDE